MPGIKTTNRTPAFSRRHFWKMLASACLCRAGAQQTDPVPDPFRWDDPANKAERSERQYRVDAQILLFGATLFRRNGVGGGNAAWSEAGERRKLEFTGFAFPDKAAGLKRFGFIEEVSSSGKEFAYFGLMTSSLEKRPMMRSFRRLRTTIRGRPRSSQPLLSRGTRCSARNRYSSWCRRTMPTV